MAIQTKIEYADSTLNLMMGCTGCELYNPSWDSAKNTCYAERITANKAGSRGWPERFNKPAIFSERINLIDKWPDLTGTDRPDKLWLNGLPRIIFLNDMGDTFTEDLPLDWISPFLDRMAQSPHYYLFLTKRPHRMQKFFNEKYWTYRNGVPNNFILGTSITRRENLQRLLHLEKLRGSAKTWVSFEPLLENVIPMEAHWLKWIVAGGESGYNARRTETEWFTNLQQFANEYKIPYFFKQMTKKQPIPQLLFEREMPKIEMAKRRLFE